MHCIGDHRIELILRVVGTNNIDILFIENRIRSVYHNGSGSKIQKWVLS